MLVDPGALRERGLAQAGRFTWTHTVALTLAAYRTALGPEEPDYLEIVTGLRRVPGLPGAA